MEVGKSWQNDTRDFGPMTQPNIILIMSDNQPADLLGCYGNGEAQKLPEAVFMEQEETRAVRTKDWLYMKRFDGAASYPLSDELYDLQSDWIEKHNLIASSEYDDIKIDLNRKIDGFFSVPSQSEYNL